MEKEKMNGGGRGVTEYRAEYDEQAYKYCLLGATNETLAEFFGVSATTIKKWMHKYPGFKESVRRGKDVADMEVARSLYKRAVGYSYEQVVSEYVRVADNQGEAENVTPTVGTFLQGDSNGLQKVSLATIQAGLEKVIAMLGAFLNEDGNGLQKSGLAVIQGELEKVTCTVGTFLNKGGNGLQKNGVANTQTGSEKVTCTVGTFLDADKEDLKKKQIDITQTGSEKVTCTVGTFLDEGGNGLQKSGVAVTQTGSEKVTCTVGTFLDEEREGLKKIRVTTREVIPDVRAQIFWLKNRRPDLWRDKQEIDHTADGEKMSYVKIFELPDDGRNPELTTKLKSR
jgi:hypothetical protein